MTTDSQSENYSDFKLAFEQTRAERDAIPEGLVEALSIDPYHAAQQVLRHRHALSTLVEPCRATLPTVDAACFTRLVRLAHALVYAHAQCLATVRPAPPLQAASARLAEIRARLYAQLKLETRRAVVADGWQKHMRGPRGYVNQARDVILMVMLFRNHWPALAGKLPITVDELHDAEQRAQQMLAMVGDRQREQVAHAAQVERDRAYTALMHCFREVQRAAHFLRFYQGDAAAYVPNLSTPHKKRLKPGTAPPPPG